MMLAVGWRFRHPAALMVDRLSPRKHSPLTDCNHVMIRENRTSWATGNGLGECAGLGAGFLAFAGRGIGIAAISVASKPHSSRLTGLARSCIRPLNCE
jgi:hypothetical protein